MAGGGGGEEKKRNKKRVTGKMGEGGYIQGQTEE